MEKKQQIPKQIKLIIGLIKTSFLEEHMKSKWTKVILLSLLCLAVFCLIATTANIFSVGDLPANFVAAFLEAVVTAVITVLLLSGQSAAEEVKERNVKVFEKKSEIFHQYIDLVWNIWEDHIVTGDEYDNLTSAYYKRLMIYLNKNSLQKIGICLKNIGQVVDNETPDESILRDNIVQIINTLSDELSLGGHIDDILFNELDSIREVARRKRPKFNFKVLGIPSNETIEFIYKNKKEQAIVSGENKVLYGNKEYSLTKLTKELMEIEKDIQPTPYWYYNGKNLKDLYEQKYVRQK
jgi:hypothetical protein